MLGNKRSVMLDFHGSRGGRATTTWAQRDMWLTIEANQPHTARFQVPMITEVPPGVDVASVVRALGRLIERHETLRTLFHPRPDCPPDQEVVRQGRMTVHVREVDAAPELRDIAALMADMDSHGPAPTPKWPVGFAVLTRLDSPAWVIGSLSHLVVDAVALDLLVEELRHLLDGGDAGKLPEPRHQPLDRVRYEESPLGRSAQRTALRLWSEGLGSVAWPQFRDSADADGTHAEAEAEAEAEDADEPRYPCVTLYSKGAGARVARAARGLHLAPSAVFVAAAAAALGRAAGVDGCSLVITCSNRWGPDTVRYTGCIAQQGLLVLPSLDGTLHDLARSIWPDLVGMHRNSMWDPYELYPLISALKGQDCPGLEHYVNVLAERSPVLPPDAMDLADGEFLLLDSPPITSTQLRFGLNIRSDGNDVAIRMFSDRRCLPPEVQRDIVVDIHRSLRDSADGDNLLAVSARRDI